MTTESTICKSLQYPLPALTLTKQECTSIMVPVLQSSLPKTSTCRNLPRAAVYAPKEEGGLGITNLYAFQGNSHVANSMTGQLPQTSLEYAQLVVWEEIF